MLTFKEMIKFLPTKWVCPYCNKKFKTEKGAKIHMVRFCKEVPDQTGD
jgi:hypothetical protein